MDYLIEYTLENGEVIFEYPFNIVQKNDLVEAYGRARAELQKFDPPIDLLDGTVFSRVRKIPNLKR